MLRTQFTPPMIANLAVWLDAADASRMYQLSTGSTAVAANNDPVGYVGCYVGGNALQATTNNRPLWITGAQNGLPVLRFDGSNDSLQIGSVALQGFMAVFVAGKFTTSKPIFIEHSANASNNDGFYVYGGTTNTLQIRRSALLFTRNASGSAWMGSSFAVVDYIHGGKPDVSITKNGAVETLTTGTGGDSTLSDTSISSALNICSRNQASVFSDGDLGELIIYNRRITDAEARIVRRYLGRKWGVAVA